MSDTNSYVTSTEADAYLISRLALRREDKIVTSDTTLTWQHVKNLLATLPPQIDTSKIDLCGSEYIANDTWYRVDEGSGRVLHLVHRDVLFGLRQWFTDDQIKTALELQAQGHNRHGA